MKKSDLVEVARKELGMSLAEANAKTEVILKEKIRINRRVNMKPLGLTCAPICWDVKKNAHGVKSTRYSGAAWIFPRDVCAFRCFRALVKHDGA